MNTTDQTEFWDRYDRVVRPVVERACQRASRLHTEGTMDPADMAAWVHTRVWQMLEKDTFPTFHDQPSVDEAIDRLLTHAGVLARWSYLALSRRHWKRLERESASDLSRVEHLSVSRRADAEIEDREAIDAALDKVRSALPDSVRGKLAASLQDRSERRRAAVAIGATSRDDDRLISQVNAGLIKENTVQQMRSRAKRHAIEAIGSSIRLPLILVVAASMWLTVPVEGGEQSGGRKGTKLSAQRLVITDLAGKGEQSGGRKPGTNREEQSGGRGTP